MSVNTDESVVVMEDVSSSQGESVTHVVGATELVFPVNTFGVPVGKIEKSEEEKRAVSPEQVRNETVADAASYILGSTVPCEDLGKDQDDLFMPAKCAAVFGVLEVEEYVGVVGSITQVMSVLSLRGSPSKKLWALPLLETQAGLLILLVFLCVSFCLIFTTF